MTKTYVAPTVITNGDIVTETLGPTSGGVESQGKHSAAGSVGFYL